MHRFCLWVGCATAVAAAGCVRIEPATPSGENVELTNDNDPDFAKRTVKWDHEAFPKSAPLVEAAEAERDPVKAESAFRAAIKSIEAERSGTTDSAHPDSWGHLMGRARAGLGMSLHAQNRDLDAALMLADGPYDPNKCHATVRARCKAYSELVVAKYPSMVYDEGSVRLFTIDRLPITRTTSIESIDMLQRRLESTTIKGPVLLRAAITTKKPAGADVRLEVEGVTSSALHDKCKEVGTLEIPAENKHYILELCKKEKMTFIGANVVARTSSADAANVTEEKNLGWDGKNDVYLLVDPKQMKRTSKTALDLGKVSIVRAPKRGE